MSENQRKKPFWFLHDYQEGTGNIWGWKFSIFGLIFIGSLTALAVYRHITLDVPFGYDPKAEEEVILHPYQQNAKKAIASDTLKLDSLD
jgi:hypothetical protein